MSNTEFFLALSLLGNFLMIYVVVITISLYTHARQWRDQWRDAHVDTLRELRDELNPEKVQP